jgi:tripartite-type tricarboxylate transporter receptor subunit TctC
MARPLTRRAALRASLAATTLATATLATAALATATLVAGTPAYAQEWPARDITFIVPYAPGGSTDPISRKYCELLEKELKVKLIVENKPGASATIGTGAVVRATPDGYTIGLGSNSSLAFQPLEMKGLPWKDTDGYQSVVKLVDLPAVLAVPADSRFKTLDDFLDEAKKTPGKLKVSVSGLRTANDIAVQHFNKLSGLRITTVPFTGGGGEAILAALGGRVDGVVGYAAGMKGQVDAGKLRVIGAFNDGKYYLFPDAKPTSETPWKSYLRTAYYVIAPKGVPQPILDKLNAASKKVVESDDFKAFATANGYTVDVKFGDAMKKELMDYERQFKEVNDFLEQTK